MEVATKQANPCSAGQTCKVFGGVWRPEPDAHAAVLRGVHGSLVSIPEGVPPRLEDHGGGVGTPVARAEAVQARAEAVRRARRSEVTSLEARLRSLHLSRWPALCAPLLHSTFHLA